MIYFIKKAAIVLSLILMFIISAFLYVDHWVKISLPEILNNNPQRTYDIRYVTYAYDWLTNSIEIQQITIRPVNELSDNTALEGAIHTLGINKVDLCSLLINKQIRAEEIYIDRPEFYMMSEVKNKKASRNSESLGLFWKDMYHSIAINNVRLTNGSIVVYDNLSMKQTLLSENINIDLKDVRIDSSSVSNPLPFSYDHFVFKVGNSKVDIGAYYQIKLDGFVANDNGLEFTNFDWSPTVSKIEFCNRIKFEQDYISCFTDKVSLKKTKWSFYNDTLKIKADRLDINKMEMSLYRNKNVVDGSKKKKFYSQILRELPFYITIDSVALNSGSVVYQEQKRFGAPTGRLSFDDVKIKGHGIDNFRYQEKDKLTVFDFSSQLCESGRLKANLAFNINDLKDSYQMNGKLLNLDINKLNQFVTPLMDVSATGKLHRMNFLINGSVNDAVADISLEYQKLKVSILNKKTKKRNYFKSKVANLLVKSNVKRQKSNEHVYLKRVQSKSMYYQIWQCVQHALKDIVVIRGVN